MAVGNLLVINKIMNFMWDLCCHNVTKESFGLLHGSWKCSKLIFNNLLSGFGYMFCVCAFIKKKFSLFFCLISMLIYLNIPQRKKIYSSLYIFCLWQVNFGRSLSQSASLNTDRSTGRKHTALLITHVNWFMLLCWGFFTMFPFCVWCNKEL